MTNQEIIAKAEPILELALTPLGIEVVHIEYQKDQGRWIFRVFIDHENGVTHNTCQEASHVIGQVMDESDLISQSYYLEVSSPGLDRIIKKDRDFERFREHKVKIRAIEPVDGQKSFVGILKGLENGVIQLDADGRLQTIPREKVKQVRLVPEL